MQQALKFFLYAHIAAGGLALLTGAVALLVKKGGKVHRKAGFVFFCAMLLVSVTALFISVVKNIPFLLAISVFGFYMNYFGYRVLKNKSGVYTWYDWLATVLAAGTALYMVASGVIVLTVFGIILMVLLIRNVVPQFKPEANAKQAAGNKVVVHLINMSATYIATLTAFMVVNVNFVKPGWIVWLLPTAIGVPFIIFETRRRKK